MVPSSSETPPFRWHYADLDDTTTTQLRGRTLIYVVILFAIILLASLLFFYARWVCRTSRHQPPNSSHSTSAAAANDGDWRRRGGLDVDVISALPVLLYGSELVEVGGGDAECCICLSLFEEDEKVKVLPECSHSFHSDCVDRWLVSQSSCPLCRSSLTFHQLPADVVVSTRVVID